MLVAEQQDIDLELTHGNDIRISIIHTDVIFSRPFQANICPGLQYRVFIPDIFHRHHEFLETRYCKR